VTSRRKTDFCEEAGCSPGGEQSAGNVSDRMGLRCQGADHAGEADEKRSNADAINHSETDVFGWIDGQERPQEPAFSFYMNNGSSHFMA
jgi:hypothetical protein